MNRISSFAVLFFTLTVLLLTGPVFANKEAVQNKISRIKLLDSFKQMYEKKHFSDYLFDLKKGYLQTSAASNDDKMPMDYFVKYNNAWWFNIIKKVVVPSVAYDPETDTGFIILNIYYGQNNILRAMQYIKFTGNKINYIRTYTSPKFWNSDNPLIKLDRYGNQIWLTTGYGFSYAAKAALDFFNSPVGKSFENNPETMASVKAIKQSLSEH